MSGSFDSKLKALTVRPGGRSRKELAKKLGCKPDYIAFLEKSALIKIQDALEKWTDSEIAAGLIAQESRNQSRSNG